MNCIADRCPVAAGECEQDGTCYLWACDPRQPNPNRPKVMSLCPHGYTANLDCPFCGIGKPPAPAKQAPRPVSNDELLSQFAELVLCANAARLVA